MFFSFSFSSFSLSLSCFLLNFSVVGEGVGNEVSESVASSASLLGGFVGLDVGMKVGGAVGSDVGMTVGGDVGSIVGMTVGGDVGSIVGMTVGDALPSAPKLLVDVNVGIIVGKADGSSVFLPLFFSFSSFSLSFSSFSLSLSCFLLYFLVVGEDVGNDVGDSVPALPPTLGVLTGDSVPSDP